MGTWNITTRKNRFVGLQQEYCNEKSGRYTRRAWIYISIAGASGKTLVAIMNARKLLAPWLFVSERLYHIRYPIDKLGMELVILTAHMEAAVVMNDNAMDWHYLIFDDWLNGNNLYNKIPPYQSFDEAKIACDAHLIQLGYTLLDEDRARKLSLLL
jgi:hypothetical protein